MDDWVVYDGYVGGITGEIVEARLEELNERHIERGTMIAYRNRFAGTLVGLW